MIKKIILPVLTLIFIITPLTSFAGERVDIDKDLWDKVFADTSEKVKIETRVMDGEKIEDSQIIYDNLENKHLSFLIFQILRNQQQILAAQKDISDRLTALEQVLKKPAGDNESDKSQVPYTIIDPKKYIPPKW